MLTLWQRFPTAWVAIRPACLFGAFELVLALWAHACVHCGTLAYVHACVLRACTNNKLTAAVKFLPEHHRGEADESRQAARARGGGRGRRRWAGAERGLVASETPVIEGSLGRLNRSPRLPSLSALTVLESVCRSQTSSKSSCHEPTGFRLLLRQSLARHFF